MSLPDSLLLTKLPFAIFFNAQDVGDKITLSSRLRDAAQGLLDGESLILPVPPNGPPDLPRVQLQSSDKCYILQLSTIRLAFERNSCGPAPVNWNSGSGPYLEALAGILRVFAGEYSRPLRFVFNPQFLVQLNRSANDYLTQELFRAGRVARRPFSTRISLSDQLLVKGFPLTLSFNIATARQQNRPEIDHALVLQFEMQSAKEGGGSYSADEIMGVLSETEALMEERIREVLGDLFKEEN